MKYIDLTIKGEKIQIKAEELKGQIWFHVNGTIFVWDKKTTRAKASAKGPAQQTQQPAPPKTLNKGQVLSPMPGQIVQVFVRPQQTVKENQTLLILSSMKMEYVIRAPAGGVIKSIKAKEGAQVSAKELLIELRQKNGIL